MAQNQASLLWSILDGLDPRLAELVILQQGLLNENAYCWGHHVPVAEDLGYARSRSAACGTTISRCSTTTTDG